MKILITIDTSNAAFADDPHGSDLETARILKNLSNVIAMRGTTSLSTTILDSNGNTCGSAQVTE